MASVLDWWVSLTGRSEQVKPKVDYASPSTLAERTRSPDEVREAMAQGWVPISSSAIQKAKWEPAYAGARTDRKGDFLDSVVGDLTYVYVGSTKQYVLPYVSKKDWDEFLLSASKGRQMEFYLLPKYSVGTRRSARRSKPWRA